MFSFIIVIIIFSFQSTAMRIVLQRVKSASVQVEGRTISSIERGMVALVGLHEDDTEEDAIFCSKKILAAKLWCNLNGTQWR